MKAMIGKGVAKGTWTNFNTTYKHVAAFLAAQYDVNEINTSYSTFLCSLQKGKTTQKNINSIRKMKFSGRI